MIVRTFVRLIAAACLASAGLASAQAWPSRPITVIVPFAPGAASDGIARILAQELSTSLGQPVVVENKPGAGGTTGPSLVARATPDGHTIGLAATGAIVVNPNLPDGAPLNVKELAPIAKLADIPLVLAAHPASGFGNLEAFLQAGRSTAGGVNVGNNGQNTSQHLAAELLATMTGVRMVAVPYKGSAPAATALLGAEVPVAMVDLTSVYPHIKAGKLIGLGVTSAQRSKVAPDLPTIAEGGVPGYAAPAWMGLFAPAKTPPAVVAQISRAVQAALAKPEVESKLIALSSEPGYLGPAEFARFLDVETAKWGKVIEAARAGESRKP